MKHVRVVALLGLGPQHLPFPHYTPVFYEDEGGRRTPHPVPLPFLQVLLGISAADVQVSLVVLGTPKVREKWIDTHALDRMLGQYLLAPQPFAFIEVPSGDPDVDQPGEASAAARFVDLLLPCLRREPLEVDAHHVDTERGWEKVDEVVFDVTNGFRAQSVLSTTAIVAAVEQAIRDGKPPALRVQYGAFDQRKDDVAPVWDLTGMVTQHAWVRAIDALVTNARADAFEALCKDLAAERIGTQYRDRGRQQEKQALRGLGASAQTLADDLVCARTHAVLTSSARTFCECLERAAPLIAAHAPAAARPLQDLAALARPLVCERVVSLPGLHAQLALARASVETERYAVTTSILREMLVCVWHLETVGEDEPWQPCSGDAARDAEWLAVEASLKNVDGGDPEGLDPTRARRIRNAYRQLVDLRNDVQHAGMRSQPRSSKQVREQAQKKLEVCATLVRDLYPQAGRTEHG